MSEYTHDDLPCIGSKSDLNRDYIGSYYQYLVTSGVFRDKNRYVIVITLYITLYVDATPINLPDHAFFIPMSTDSPPIPHRASTGYTRDSVNRALIVRLLYEYPR